MKYEIEIKVTAWKKYTVEADSEEEALKIGEEEASDISFGIDISPLYGDVENEVDVYPHEEE